MIRLNDEFIPPERKPRADIDIQQLTILLQHGDTAARHSALATLIAAGAEDALTRCLKSKDSLTVQLASAGLWECWLNEKGPHARRRMDKGVELMNKGELAAAQRIFFELAIKYPDWAEATNKQATVLYLRGLAGDGFDLCQLVVAVKPHHFGAWNGLALCAAQQEDWETVLSAAKKALHLQPGTRANLELVQLAKLKLGRA